MPYRDVAARRDHNLAHSREPGGAPRAGAHQLDVRVVAPAEFGRVERAVSYRRAPGDDASSFPRPARTPMVTASRLECASSFASRFRMWVRTVFLET